MRRLLIVGFVAALGLWFAFFDSHSLAQRVHLAREKARLTAENERLRRDIATLETRLATPLADSTVERIAREQHGLQRAGETRYPVVRATP